MARQHVFSTPTKLWHPVEGWREFPAGETDPGAAWHEKEGGGAVGDNAAAGALKDLIEANDRIDQMGQQLASKDHDLAQMAQERDSANAALGAAEQAARDAETAKAELEAAAATLTQERDAARAEVERVRADAKAAEELADAANAKVEGLVAQLGDANQQIADLKAAAEKPAESAAKK